ncbi:hypothetical protein PAMA_006724 [Pampus argenteus]
MSAGCMRWMLSHTVRAVCGSSPGYVIPASKFFICTERSNIIAAPWRSSPFSTAADDTKQTPAPGEKQTPAPGEKQTPAPREKQTPAQREKQTKRTNAIVGITRRKIPHSQLQLISETGENMGTVQRADVLNIMDTKGLKLVMLSEHKDLPVYQLMSGKQFHEEQRKQREKQKAKAGVVQVKELTFKSGIGTQDQTFKLKQAESWLQKKHHVRLTLATRRKHPLDNLVTNLEQMVQQMEITVGFVSAPKIINDGRAAMCIIRLPSAKDLMKKKKETTSLEAAQSETSPVNNTDTTEASTQQ